MLGFKALRDIFEGRLQEAAGNGNDSPQAFAQGRMTALREFHNLMGLETSGNGRAVMPLDERGLPVLRPGRCLAREVSLRHLAEAICGHEFTEEYYHPSGGFDFGNRQLFESALDPSAFVNINTLNLATSGLLNAEIMEHFSLPEYFGRNLVKIVPTKLNGHKRIGTQRISPVSSAAKGRKPGESHAEIGFGEAYQTTPETVEQALKIKVTREAYFFDLTGDVLNMAGDVGDELAYGQEKDIADMVLGVTAGYNRNGTSYNTYQTSSPWINDSVNPFADWQDIDDSRQLFIGLTDPDTGREIVVRGFTILCMPGRELRFRQQLFGSNVQMGTQLNSNFPSTWTMGGNPLAGAGGNYTVTSLGPIWYNRATASDGLALSASDATGLWFAGDYSKAFEWHENWPMTTWMASAEESAMKDTGLVAVHGANYRGVGFPNEPRYAQRNKAA